jgi:chromosome segregation protein
MLMAQASHMQFVVITHNRHTIEAAETVYGISMEDQGVSQSISLQVSSPAVAGGAPSGP